MRRRSEEGRNDISLKVPNGWSVKTLGQIAAKLTDGSHNPPKKCTDGLPMLSGRNIKSGKIVFDEFRFIEKQSWEIEDKRTKISDGDVLLSIVGTIGEAAVYTNEIPRFTVQRSVAVVSAKDHLDPKFLAYWLRSPVAQEYFFSNAKGTAQKGVYLGVLSQLPTPLTDRNTQRKIVNKIDSLFSEIDVSLEELKSAKANLDLYKQSVLNAAIQGKLVPQNPKDEPASKLLERIQAGKEKLVKAGKIKKEKSLSPISSDELPFELPSGWAWVRLGELLKIESGSVWDFPASDESGIPYVKVGDMNDPRNEHSVQFSSNYFKNSKESLENAVPLNSIIFPKRGGAIATNKRRYVVDTPILIDMNTMSITVPDAISFDYIKNWFGTIDLNRISGGAGVVPQINNKDVAPILIPIPPRDEQIRISEAIVKALSDMGHILEEVENGVKNLSLLKQSILKSAFEGTLV